MVDTMCNLSEGVFERGWNKGWNKGWDKGWNKGWDEGADDTARKIIIGLLEKNMDMTFITSVVKCSPEYVRAIAEAENLPIKE